MLEAWRRRIKAAASEAEKGNLWETQATSCEGHRQDGSHLDYKVGRKLPGRHYGSKTVCKYRSLLLSAMTSSNLGRKGAYLADMTPSPTITEGSQGRSASSSRGRNHGETANLLVLLQPAQVHLPRDGVTHPPRATPTNINHQPHRLVHGPIWLEMIPWLKLPLPRWLQLLSSWLPPQKKALSIKIKMKMGRRKYSWSVHRIECGWSRQTSQGFVAIKHLEGAEKTVSGWKTMKDPKPLSGKLWLSIPATQQMAQDIIGFFTDEGYGLRAPHPSIRPK